MFLEFCVSNYLSIKDELKLSFVASTLRENLWYCFKKCVWTQAHQLLRFCKYINISVKAG